MATQISLENFEKELDENWTQECQKSHSRAMYYDRQWTEFDDDLYSLNPDHSFPSIDDFISSLEVSDEDLDDLFDEVVLDIY